MRLLIGSILILVNVFLSFRTKQRTNNYFEGKIVYKHEVIIKNPKVDSMALREYIGHGSTLYFKEGNYLHTYNGGGLVKDIYRKDDNKGYFKTNFSDTSFWIDCSQPGDKILNLSFTPKKEKILGIECDELIVYYKDNIVTDYYNSDSIKIDPNWFKDYKLDGQDQIDQKEKSIFLKHKTEYANFIIVQTAVSISKEKLNDEIFKLSSKEILIKRE